MNQRDFWNVFARRTNCLVLILILVPSSRVAAQPVCDSATLEMATGTYDIGRFATTFDLLRPCLPDGFVDRGQRVGAYRLMALSYIARDSLDRARETVRRLLRADSRFKADSDIDPPAFTRLVSDLKPRWYTWLWRGNAWYHWTGRAVLAGGVASLPFLLGKDEPDLPPPPNFPTP